MESRSIWKAIFAYDLGDTNYVAPMLGSRTHWVRQLPGQLLHNIVSHGVAKLAEFLDDQLDEIVATSPPESPSSQSRRARGAGRVESDDWRSDEAQLLTFAFQLSFGPDLTSCGSLGRQTHLVVDHGTGSLVRNKNRSCKSYLTYFLPPLHAAREHVRCAQLNLINFLRRRLHQDFRMK